MKKTKIDRADILDLPAYEKARQERRKQIAEIKRHRRVAVGPNATFHFECYETMLYQIQEMLRAERGGDEQLKEELAAYDPMVPKGTELVATVMFEVEEPVARDKFLSGLGGVEDHIFVEVGGARVAARPEEDLERTMDSGKTSSVHFLHFDLTKDQAEAFKKPGTRVLVGIEHPSYGHVAILNEDARKELASDLT
jgi:hypothetical protein